MSTGNLIKVENFSDRLRRARKTLGLGQKELAEKLGVSSGSVGNWEVGPTLPQPDTLGKLAAALGKTPEFLLYGEEKAKVAIDSTGHRLVEPAPVYRVNEEIGGTEDQATREKCKAHFDQFLSTCKTRSQVGWVWCELLEKFPLTKFKGKDES